MNEALKRGLARAAAKQIFKILLTRAAFLSFGPFSFLANEILFRLAYKFLDMTIIGLHLMLIDLDVDKNVENVKKVLNKIKSMGEDVTEEEKEKADRELAKVGIDVIRFK